MSTRSGSLFAALLMSGPLAAIPLMAMFGVPQFATVSASTDNAPDDVLQRPSALFATDAQTSELTDQSTTVTPNPEKFNPFTESVHDRSDVSVQTEPTGDIVDTSRGFAINTMETEASFSTPLSSEIDSTPGREVASALSRPSQSRPTPTTLATTPPAPPQAPTWENAAQKLQEMGIDDYRLERGLDGDTFVFICQFAPGTDTRIIRRFEAEATAPAEAVRDVLEQVTNWQSTNTIH